VAAAAALRLTATRAIPCAASRPSGTVQDRRRDGARHLAALRFQDHDSGPPGPPSASSLAFLRSSRAAGASSFSPRARTAALRFSLSSISTRTSRPAGALRLAGLDLVQHRLILPCCLHVQKLSWSCDLRLDPHQLHLRRRRSLFSSCTREPLRLDVFWAAISSFSRRGPPRGSRRSSPCTPSTAGHGLLEPDEACEGRPSWGEPSTSSCGHKKRVLPCGSTRGPRTAGPVPGDRRNSKWNRPNVMGENGFHAMVEESACRGRDLATRMLHRARRAPRASRLR